MAVVGEDNFQINNWSGIFLDADPQYITDSQLSLCNNFLIGNNGVLEKRKPVVQLLTDTGTSGVIDTISMMGELIRETQTYTLWHDHGARESYYTTGLSTGLVNIPGLSGQIVWGSCQYIRELFVATEGKVFVWTPDGGASAISSSPTGIRQIIALNDRLFGFVRSELYFSQPGTPENWPSTNVIKIRDGDGDDLQCMIPYDGRLVLFKTSSTWALHFSDDPLYWIVNWINFDVGCRGPRAAKLYRNVIYVMDRNGCWATDTVTFRKLSDPIDTFFKDSKMLLVQLDIFSDHVSIYKDWVIFHQKFGGDWAYRTTPPQGFTTLIWNAPNSGGSLPNYLWFDIQEQKIHGQNGRFIASIGNRVYQLGNYGQAGAELVTAEFITKYYDITRVSRVKRMKHAYTVYQSGQPAAAHGLSYAWITDDDTNPNLTAFPESPARTTASTKSLNMRGAEFSRVVGMRVKETIPNSFNLNVFSVNLVLHTHRQQSETNQ